MLNIIKKCR